MSINNLIHKRFSTRAFADKLVSNEHMELLFEAARWAPSARNEQPWRFYYATKENSEVYNQYFSILNEWNQKWANTAPVIIAAVSKLNYDHKNLPNSYAWYDLGQAVAYLTLQATEIGLYMHQMGGFYPEKAKVVLELPDGFQAVTMIALGYKGDLERIPMEYQKLETVKRERMELSSFVFKGNKKVM